MLGGREGSQMKRGGVQEKGVSGPPDPPPLWTRLCLFCMFIELKFLHSTTFHLVTNGSCIVCLSYLFGCRVVYMSCQFIDTAAAPPVFKYSNNRVFMCQYSCRLLFYFYDCDSSLLTRLWRKYKIKILPNLCF